MTVQYDVHTALAAKASLLRSGTSSGIGLAVWERRGGGEIAYTNPDHHTFSLYLRGGNHVRRGKSNSNTRRRANATGSPGAICVIPRGSDTTWENRGYVRWLHVYYRDRHLEAATNGRTCRPVAITFGCDPALRELAQRFLLALDWHSETDRAVLDHGLAALLVRSLAIEHTTSEFRTPTGGLTGGQRRAVEEAVTSSLAERFGVADLAEVAGLSPRQFSRAFTISYGVAPYEWVLQKRVETAGDLLADGCTAQDVAIACGFSSQSHMIRRFRAVLGYTPGRLQ